VKTEFETVRFQELISGQYDCLLRGDVLIGTVEQDLDGDWMFRIAPFTEAMGMPELRDIAAFMEQLEEKEK
jgi:hypothetical protein